MNWRERPSSQVAPRPWQSCAPCPASQPANISIVDHSIVHVLRLQRRLCRRIRLVSQLRRGKTDSVGQRGTGETCTCLPNRQTLPRPPWRSRVRHHRSRKPPQRHQQGAPLPPAAAHAGTACRSPRISRPAPAQSPSPRREPGEGCGAGGEGQHQRRRVSVAVWHKERLGEGLEGVAARTGAASGLGAGCRLPGRRWTGV